VVAPDPKRHRRGVVVDEDAADVGFAGQQIISELAGLWDLSACTRLLHIELIQTSLFPSAGAGPGMAVPIAWPS
jgi:hypothetical protein